MSTSERLTPDILVFKNFLTQEECESVLKYWEHCVENKSLNWDPISFYESYASNLPDTDDMEKFGLVSQINRSAVSIPSNIAEGAGRLSKKEFIQFLGYAVASSFEFYIK